MSTRTIAQQLREVADALDEFSATTDALKLLQGAKNAIDTAQASITYDMIEALDHQAVGYSSPKNFLRAELGLDSIVAHTLIAAGSTLKVLPEVAQVASAGGMSLDHVRYFTYALRHVGEEHLRPVLPQAVDAAAKCEPQELKSLMRELREAVYPDSLDQAWINGMDREDIKLSPVPEGFHVTGFVNPTTGAKFKELLQSLSAPTGADDPREPSQRRVDGFEKLLDGVLNAGLPGDKGVRPHVTITVDAAMLTDERGSAQLSGYGAIGLRQIQEIICGAEITPVVIDKATNKTLDVGRSSRLGMKTQRRAIVAQQQNRCAAPGCHGPVVHLHHIVYWSRGGQTDLSNLIGLCPRCHRAVHAGIVTIDPRTHEFRNRAGRLLPGRDPRQRSRRRLTPPRTRHVRYRNELVRS